MSCRLSLLGGAVGGTLMGLLMSLVNLATPGSLRFFELVHSPINPILGNLDRRFHFETGGDSDSYYWLLAFLCYWTFIGIISSLAIWFVCRRKQPQIFKAPMIFLTIAWLFMAGVLTWALVTIHSYGGHWGFAQNVPTAIIRNYPLDKGGGLGVYLRHER